MSQQDRSHTFPRVMVYTGGTGPAWGLWDHISSSYWSFHLLVIFQPWVFLGWLQLMIDYSCAEMLLNKHIIFHHSISLFASSLFLSISTSSSHAITFKLVAGFKMHLTVFALMVEKLFSSYMLCLGVRKGPLVSFLQKNQVPNWPQCFRHAGKQLLYFVHLLEVWLLLYHTQHYKIQWLNTQKSGFVSSKLVEILASILIPSREYKHFCIWSMESPSYPIWSEPCQMHWSEGR